MCTACCVIMCAHNIMCITFFKDKVFDSYKMSLISGFLNRSMGTTRWSKHLGDPAIYLDVILARAKHLTDRLSEEYATMGITQDDVDYVTVDDILTIGRHKITLIEGDPGAGKTTITTTICKRWAQGEILTEMEFVFFIPLRHYQNVTNLDELFGELDYPEMTQYIEQTNCECILYILDGWDELCDSLQSKSLFYDMLFKTKRSFNGSTIIVTSRPTCSGSIAKVIEDHLYYQILGFTPSKVEKYIKLYFKSNSLPANQLIQFLNENHNLYQHFYTPITAAIMCFVYSSKKVFLIL